MPLYKIILTPECGQTVTCYAQVDKQEDVFILIQDKVFVSSIERVDKPIDLTKL